MQLSVSHRYADGKADVHLAVLSLQEVMIDFIIIHGLLMFWWGSVVYLLFSNKDEKKDKI